MLQILFFSAILGTEVAIKILKFRSWGYASNKPKVLKNVSLHVLICQKMMYDIIISEGTTRDRHQELFCIPLISGQMPELI